MVTRLLLVADIILELIQFRGAVRERVSSLTLILYIYVCITPCTSPDVSLIPPPRRQIEKVSARTDTWHAQLRAHRYVYLYFCISRFFLIIYLIPIKRFQRNGTSKQLLRRRYCRSLLAILLAPSIERLLGKSGVYIIRCDVRGRIVESEDTYFVL